MIKTKDDSVIEKASNLTQNNKANGEINELIIDINKDMLYEYYRYHTRAETAEHFNITDSILRKLLKIYDIKKNTDERRYTANKFIDMTGWVMKEHGIANSRIQIVSFNKIINNQTYWNCICECGKEFIGNGAKIRSGQKLSCGCLHKEKIIKHARELGYVYGGYNKKYNKYDLSNDFGIGFFITGEKFYFDLEDYDKIKNFYWENNHGYAVARIYELENQEYIYMHRLIIGAKNEEIVDHIDRNRLNNFKNNLRITDNSGNARNASLAKNNTSGITGVTFDKRNNKWIAQITTHYQNKRLGSFINKEDAIRARLCAEKEYFGEFAPQRHLFERYGII